MFVNAVLHTPLISFSTPKLLRARIVKYDQFLDHVLNTLFMFRQYDVFWRSIQTYQTYVYSQLTKPFFANYLRIKIKFRKFRKFKPLRSKFIYNEFFDTYATTLNMPNLRFRRLAKISIRKLFPMVLKSRRLLKILWSKFIWKAKQLTTHLLKLFKKNSSTHRTSLITLSTVLVTFGIAGNLFDANYWVSNQFVQVNAKTTTNGLYCVIPGDIINFSLCVFAAKYTAYFSKFYVRWLRRKKKKNTRKVTKFINDNRLPLQIKKHFRRWLLLSRMDKLTTLNLDVDYQTNMICCFFKRINRTTSSNINTVYRPLGIFNLWYYNY